MRGARSSRVNRLFRRALLRRPDIAASVLVLGVPLLLLLLAGVRHIISEGLGLEFAAISLASVVAVAGFRLAWQWRRAIEVGEDGGDAALLASRDWGRTETEAYEAVCGSIRDRTRALLDWDSELPGLCREIADEAAAQMSGGKRNSLDVTIPELLGLLDQVSRDCREFIRFAVISTALRQFSVNNIRWLLRNRRQLARVVEGSNHLFRVAGLVVNPPAGAMRMLEMLIADRNTAYLTAEFQIELQRKILNYVAARSIDLHSGRFRSGAFAEPGLVPVQPVRILIAGQAGAGRSQLAAALAAGGAQTFADSGTGDGKEARAVIGGTQCVLVEAPGFGGIKQEGRGWPRLIRSGARRSQDGREGNEIGNLFLDCDMVIWVVRADLPARRIDAEYLRLFRDVFDNYRWRLVPPLLVAVTHVDHKPFISNWPESGDLSPAQLIKVEQAVESAARAFQGHKAIAVKPAEPTWNIGELFEEVEAALPEACLAQSNRLRSGGKRAEGSRRLFGSRNRAPGAVGESLESEPQVTEKQQSGQAKLMPRLKAGLRRPGALKKRLGIGKWRNGEF